MEERRGSRKLQGVPQGQGTTELRDDTGHSAEGNGSSEITVSEKCHWLYRLRQRASQRKRPEITRELRVVQPGQGRCGAGAP